jgi:predicted transcriptional regulator
MATLTIRLPDDKHLRLKKLAESQGLIINKLIEELLAIAIVEFDTHTRFKLLAAKGNLKEGLNLLDKLDALSE